MNGHITEYRTAGNIATVNALRERGMLWRDIAPVIGISEGMLAGWRQRGFTVADDWEVDPELCKCIAFMWPRYVNSIPATAFDKKVANITGKSVADCRRHRLHLRLTHDSKFGGLDEETERRRNAEHSDRLMRNAMAKFWADRTARMAAE